MWSIIIDCSGSYGLAFIMNQKSKNKIYKLGIVDDITEFKFYNQPDPGTKDKQKPRYESRKMVLDQAQKSRLKNSRNFLEWL